MDFFKFLFLLDFSFKGVDNEMITGYAEYLEPYLLGNLAGSVPYDGRTEELDGSHWDQLAARVIH